MRDRCVFSSCEVGFLVDFLLVQWRGFGEDARSLLTGWILWGSLDGDACSFDVEWLS